MNNQSESICMADYISRRFPRLQEVTHPSTNATNWRCPSILTESETNALLLLRACTDGIRWRCTQWFWPAAAAQGSTTITTSRIIVMHQARDQESCQLLVCSEVLAHSSRSSWICPEYIPHPPANMTHHSWNEKHYANPIMKTEHMMTLKHPNFSMWYWQTLLTCWVQTRFHHYYTNMFVPFKLGTQTCIIQTHTSRYTYMYIKWRIGAHVYGLHV